MPSILFIFTSADKTLSGKPTGWYLPEAAHPYYLLAPHHDIAFASPSGANPPLDPASVDAFKEDAESIRFLADETVKRKLANAIPLKDAHAADYDALFYVGGHGPVLDLAIDGNNIILLNEAITQKKLVAAVCHGPAALVGVAKALLSGKKITGFSNYEEEQVGMVKEIPFLLETRIKEVGGHYEKAAKPWDSHVVVDGRLITGQNPNSARGVGEAIQQYLGE